MAWNPSPEVAAARDAAKKLDGAPVCIVVWLTNDAQVGMASYGKSSELCKIAGELGDALFNAALKWGADPLPRQLGGSDG